jgi:hypothetical protein
MYSAAAGDVLEEVLVNKIVFGDKRSGVLAKDNGL